jgi:hypothetical protein
MWEAEIRRMVVRSQPEQIVHETPISKITTAKWIAGVSQVVEHLHCKCDALSSYPSPTKKKKSRTHKKLNLNMNAKLNSSCESVRLF